MATGPILCREQFYSEKDNLKKKKESLHVTINENQNSWASIINSSINYVVLL